MMRVSKVLLAAALWAPTVLGSSALKSRSNGLSVRSAGNGDDLLSIYSNHLKKGPQTEQNPSGQDDAAAAILRDLGKVINDDISKRDVPTQDLINLISSLIGHGVETIVDLGRIITDSGILPKSVADFLDGYLDQDINSINNQNDKEPKQPIFPSRADGDAPYSIDEASLRAAIYIPQEFEYCKNRKKPVIFVPGTAVQAGSTFHFTFKKSFEAAGDLGDPVWINIPEASLDDVQVNAEFVAYAINYISSVSECDKVTIISWSQGGVNTQWALKYWPSTRDVVEDFIAVSPDFGGSIIANLVCPPIELVGQALCVPSFKQQLAGSNVLDVFANDDGRHAYVPTTTIYSATDEIVQPMFGPGASAIIHPRDGVEVSNNLLQEVCFAQIAGGIYTHELALANPVTWALIEDAMTHDGPGDVSRVPDLKSNVCNQLLAPALDLEDALGTEGLMVIAVANIVAYDEKSTTEPPIMPYAQ